MKLKKKFSQNFLINSLYLDNIIYYINPIIKNIYIEIGFGSANLSKKILIKFIKYNSLIYFIEIEKYFYEKFNYFYNINILNYNILNFNFSIFKKFLFYKFKINIISNLPYNITTLFFIFLIKYLKIINNQYILLQREYLINYNLNNKIFVILKSFYSIKKKFLIENSWFFPKPKINSIFLKLKILYFPLINLKYLYLYKKFLKILFFNKKKFLINILKLKIKLEKKNSINKYNFIFLNFIKKFIKYE